MDQLDQVTKLYYTFIYVYNLKNENVRVYLEHNLEFYFKFN